MIAKVLLTSAGIVIYVSTQEGEATAEEQQTVEELERRIRELSGSLGKLTEASLVPEVRSPAALWQCFIPVADECRREEILALLRRSLAGVVVSHL